jgi:hypothetical protein
MITVTMSADGWRAVERAIQETALRILTEAGVQRHITPPREWPRAARRLATARETIRKAREAGPAPRNQFQAGERCTFCGGPHREVLINCPKRRARNLGIEAAS